MPRRATGSGAALANSDGPAQQLRQVRLVAVAPEGKRRPACTRALLPVGPRPAGCLQQQRQAAAAMACQGGWAPYVRTARHVEALWRNCKHPRDVQRAGALAGRTASARVSLQQGQLPSPQRHKHRSAFTARARSEPPRLPGSANESLLTAAACTCVHDCPESLAERTDGEPTPPSRPDPDGGAGSIPAAPAGSRRAFLLRARGKGAGGSLAFGPGRQGRRSLGRLGRASPSAGDPHGLSSCVCDTAASTPWWQLPGEDGKHGLAKIPPAGGSQDPAGCQQPGLDEGRGQGNGGRAIVEQPGPHGLRVRLVAESATAGRSSHGLPAPHGDCRRGARPPLELRGASCGAKRLTCQLRPPLRLAVST